MSIWNASKCWYYNSRNKIANAQIEKQQITCTCSHKLTKLKNKQQFFLAIIEIELIERFSFENQFALDCIEPVIGIDESGSHFARLSMAFRLVSFELS